MKRIAKALRRKILGRPLLTFDAIAAELWDVDFVGDALIAAKEA